MPWKEMKTVKQIREEFARRALANEASLAALCREYGISRVTGTKWRDRFRDGISMEDQSRRPFHTPNRIPLEMEEKIISYRKEEPALGALKIHRMMEDDGVVDIPCQRTINDVLKRNGLITQEASQAATPHQRFEKDEPNDMWQADFKGDFLLQNKQRCFPLSIIDDCSRFCICADAKENTQINSTKDSFKQAFRKYGLPKVLLCDNGHPWGSSQSTSITQLEVWLMEHSVLPIHIRARHPQTQGKVERFNGSYKQERLKFYVPKDMADAQFCREEYQNFYNSRRPHHALKLDVPQKHYVPSNRQYEDDVQKWEYESGGESRIIKSSGYLTYKGHGYYLSEGIGDKTVHLYPSSRDESIIHIVFREFIVAKLDLKSNTIINRRIYLRHGDPRG